MALSAANDKFLKVRRNFSTIIGTGGVANATVQTIPLGSTTNLPTDTPVMIYINRVDSNGALQSNFEGTVGEVSGTNLINCVRGTEGTAQAWASGVVVEVIWTETNVNRMVDGILTEHNQDGTHKSALVTTLKASGANVVTGTSDTTIVTPKAIKDAADGLITLTDVTTNDVSTTKHGFVPKAPNDTAKFLRGDGAWASAAVSTDGWSAAGVTYTYVSATSFKIIGVDKTAVFTKGTRIKLTQTTDKYFVVTSSSFSTDTTVNITGGTDYTLANAAITSPYYSYESNPQGYPGWFAYTPTFTGFSAAPGSPNARFSVNGKICTVKMRTGTGTSSGTGFTITAPVTSSSTAGDTVGGAAQVTDNGSALTTPGNIYILQNTSSIILEKDFGGGVFTGSGSKGANFTFVYEI